MGTRDPRVDAYVAASADFARPILTHLRDLVHAAVPDVVETIKWGIPAFEHHGMLGGMAAFKQHCAFNLWRGDDLAPAGVTRGVDGMGQLGRVTSLADLPADPLLVEWLRAVAARNATRTAAPKSARAAAPRRPASAAVELPDELVEALAGQPAARATFDGLPPSHRREYAEWIAEAKRPETRQRRVTQTLEWLAEGKSRNWKYEARPSKERTTS
jgi:hypothetical protein